MSNRQDTYQQAQMPQGPEMPQQAAPAMGWRRPVGRRGGPMNFINGSTISQTFFPRKLALEAVVVYIAALIVVSISFSSYAMHWYWWLFGIIGVVGFFLLSNYYSRKWQNLREETFQKKVFWTAFAIRACMVFFLYWFFNHMTGQPFMFYAADSYEYGEEAKWMAQLIRDGDFQVYLDYKFKDGSGISDAGYPMYLGFIYLLTNDSIIIARLLKALWGAFTCVLLYKLGSRNFSEPVGRMAAIFMMLEPHYIIYSGMHLKETEMVFLIVLFLERADNLLRSRNFRFWAIVPIIGILALTFCFRTVLGLSLAFAFSMALFLSSQKVANIGRRWMILIVFVLCAGYFVGGRVLSEIESVWGQKDINQESRMGVIQRTQSLAKYATKAVFAPMIFTIPFPTMVETPNQENHRMLHAGYVVKNIMSFFCIMALILLLLNQDAATGWRNNVLLGAFLISYLLILIQSAFVHADRFHLPVYVIELLFAAYGVNQMTQRRQERWYLFWCVLMFIAWVGWAWFKLKGRGFV